MGGASGREVLRPVRLDAQQPGEASEQAEQGIRLAFFWTGGLITAVSLLSSAFAAIDTSTGFFGATAFWWLLAVLIWVLSLVAVPIVLFTLGGRVAAGVLAGIGVGTAALAVTCFANLAFGF